MAVSRKLLISVALAVSSTMVAPTPAAADPGDLDRTFGRGGVARIVGPDFFQHGFFTTDVAQGEDGTVWVLSRSYSGYTGHHEHAVITKLREDGTPDRTFGHRGRKVWEFGRYDSIGPHTTGIAAVAGGGVQIWGYRLLRDFSRPPLAFAARFDANGALDRSFGSRGVIRHRFDEIVRADGSLTHDGSTILCAYEHPHVVVWRHRPDGSLDRSFGDGGVARQSVTTGWGELSCGVDRTGRVLVAVAHGADDDRTIRAFRLTARGSVDPTFGEQGFVHHVVPPSVHIERVTDDGRGSLVAAGSYVDDAGSAHLAVYKLDPTGRPDYSFGGGDALGVADLPEIYTGPGVTRPAFTRLGSIIVAGGAFWAGEETPSTFAVRFTPSGVLDAAFGDQGLARVLAPASSGLSVAVDDSGRVLVPANRWDREDVGHLVRLEG